MKDEDKTKEQLITELAELRQRITELEASETERKRAEAEQEAARELLQATIDGVNEPIMLIGTDYQVKLMNQAVRDGYPVGKGTGPLYCYQVFHHRDTPCGGAAHPCPLEQMRGSLRPVTVVHEHVRLDGEKRLVEIIVSPLLGEDDTLTGIVESSRDITEENLGKVFEPLFTTKAKGIGLGLALVKTLVEGHGGIIEVESRLGKGSTFMVKLPVSQEEGK